MKSVLVLQTGQKMDKHLILGYYKHLLKLPQRFFDTMKVDEIISRVNDAVKIRTFINDVAIQIFVNIFIVILSFTLMFTVIQKALEEFRNQGKTVVVLAHRLSTIINSDEILVLQDGKLIEIGSHQELISIDFAYKQMWEKQSISLH